MSDQSLYCALPLAPYACRPDRSRGRLHPEPESAHRTCFQRDRDRIIHTAAFRRLKYKTQVFVYDKGDHYRTRLTHSLEVAQIARTIARALNLNEDLAEALALAHDLGHPPFAHKGEDALAVLMAPHGGFMHNDQTVRVLTELEHRYPSFPGLNLSFETLEGLIKHNGPALAKGETIADLPFTLRQLAEKHDFLLYQNASLEAQVVDLADDIAYNNHDIEDGLRAGFFTLDELCRLSIYSKIIPDVRTALRGQPESIQVFEIIRDQIGAMVGDVITASRAQIAEAAPQDVDDVRAHPGRMIMFSPAMWSQMKELRQFFITRMYQHYTQNRFAYRVHRLVSDLFAAYMDRPDMLPTEWSARIPSSSAPRVIADYIAGMTDRFAMAEHARLFNLD